MRNKLAIWGVCLGLLAALGIWFSGIGTAPEREKQPLGLMTSLPIYWRAGDLGDMLAGPDNQPETNHWVRSALEKNFDLVLLDSFAEPDSLAPNDRLAGLDYVVLAQPAALPPSDLVALDSWVRGGGRLLLFADPLLTEETDFGFGDRRRPQDMATLSPLLNRWGLTETFDPDQSAQSGTVPLQGGALPVHMFGRFAQKDAADQCTVAADAIVATCVIGQGRVTIVLDAHVLAREPETREKNRALEYLIQSAFAE